MVPRLVPEISSLDAFCDGGGGAGAGIADTLSTSTYDAQKDARRRKALGLILIDNVDHNFQNEA